MQAQGQAVTTKLPRADRRAQLLDTACAIVRAHGTDALTLGALAREAGVSKPIAYSHFETRSGLMIALYQEINERRLAAVASELAGTPATLAAMARTMSAAYMACHAALGPEWHAIGAAMKGDAEMHAYQERMIDGYVDFFHDVLAPVSSLQGEPLRRRCIGIIGAAEALSAAMVRGRVSEQLAARELESLIVHALAPATRAVK